MKEISFVNAMQLIKDGHSVYLERFGDLHKIYAHTRIEQIGKRFHFYDLIQSKWYTE